MGVTKKYFHFFMAYHLAYTEDCKAKNILKFYSRSLHQKKSYASLPYHSSSTGHLGLVRSLVVNQFQVSNTVISFLFTYISDV